MRRGRLALLAGAVSIGLVAAACGSAGATPPAASPPPSAAASPAPAASGGSAGAVDCSLVTAADLTAAGIAGASAPTDNPDGSGHYCVYAGTSGATGGVEFDVFPHGSVSDAQATYETVIGEGGPGQPIGDGAFDASSYSVTDNAAFLAVRKGRLVFALSAPDGPATQAALVGLANLVIQRAGAAAAP